MLLLPSDHPNPSSFWGIGTIAGTITTNIPTGATETFGFGEGIIKSAGTTNAHLLSDFVSFSFEQPVPVLPVGEGKK